VDSELGLGLWPFCFKARPVCQQFLFLVRAAAGIVFWLDKINS